MALPHAFHLDLTVSGHLLGFATAKGFTLVDAEEWREDDSFKGGIEDYHPLFQTFDHDEARNALIAIICERSPGCMTLSSAWRREDSADVTKIPFPGGQETTETLDSLYKRSKQEHKNCSSCSCGDCDSACFSNLDFDDETIYVQYYDRRLSPTVKLLIKRAEIMSLQMLLEDKVCPVLQEPLKAGKDGALPCGHLLSHSVYKRLMTGPQSQRKCPVCRAESLGPPWEFLNRDHIISSIERFYSDPPPARRACVKKVVPATPAAPEAAQAAPE